MTWNLPTNCAGGPESVAGYIVLMTAVMLAGWYDCGGSQCPLYAASPQMEVGFVTERVWRTMPAPELWGVDIYEVVAVDEAGNTSEDCP